VCDEFSSALFRSYQAFFFLLFHKHNNNKNLKQRKI